MSYNILLLGYVSSGKSSFINAVTFKRIALTGVSNVTFVDKKYITSDDEGTEIAIIDTPGFEQDTLVNTMVNIDMANINHILWVTDFNRCFSHQNEYKSVEFLANYAKTSNKYFSILMNKCNIDVSDILRYADNEFDEINEIDEAHRYVYIQKGISSYEIIYFSADNRLYNNYGKLSTSFKSFVDKYYTNYNSPYNSKFSITQKYNELVIVKKNELDNKVERDILNLINFLTNNNFIDKRNNNFTLRVDYVIDELNTELIKYNINDKYIDEKIQQIKASYSNIHLSMLYKRLQSIYNNIMPSIVTKLNSIVNEGNALFDMKDYSVINDVISKIDISPSTYHYINSLMIDESLKFYITYKLGIIEYNNATDYYIINNLNNSIFDIDICNFVDKILTNNLFKFFHLPYDDLIKHNIYNKFKLDFNVDFKKFINNVILTQNNINDVVKKLSHLIPPIDPKFNINTSMIDVEDSNRLRMEFMYWIENMYSSNIYITMCKLKLSMKLVNKELITFKSVEIENNSEIFKVINIRVKYKNMLLGCYSRVCTLTHDNAEEYSPLSLNELTFKDV